MNNKPPIVKYSFNLNTGFTSKTTTSTSNININIIPRASSLLFQPNSISDSERNSMLICRSTSMSPVTALNRQIRELNMINGSKDTASFENLTQLCKCGSETHLRTSHRECPLNNNKNKRKLFTHSNQPTKKTTIRETVNDF
jgi:hypothetical protein